VTCDPHDQPPRPRAGAFGSVVLGAGAGLILGAAFGNPGVGMVLGAALGKAVTRVSGGAGGTG